MGFSAANTVGGAGGWSVAEAAGAGVAAACGGAAWQPARATAATAISHSVSVGRADRDTPVVCLLFRIVITAADGAVSPSPVR